MSGTIFSICSISAFSALPAADCGKLFYSAEFERIKSSGALRAPKQQGSNLKESAGKPAAGGSNQKDVGSSSQVWQRDAKTNDSARKLAGAGTNQDLSFQESTRKVAAEISEIIVDDDSEWPNNFHISRAIQKTKKQNGRPRCGYVDMENVCDCRSAGRSSSWKPLFGKSTSYQKSATTNSETIVRKKSKAYPRSTGNKVLERGLLC